MSDATKHGQFVWYDLMTEEPAAAAEFYTKLLGWGTSPFEGGDEPYTLWTNDGQPLGGVMELPADARAAGAPPHWLAYVQVNDAGATAARLMQIGGAVHHGPTNIPGAGRFAIAADPQGAVFAIYQSSQESAGEAASSKVGGFSWHELATTDAESALRFYGDLFGWRPQEALDMGEAGVYQLYGIDGPPLGGMFTKPREMPGPPMWIFYIRVADLERAVADVGELGGKVVNGPMDVPGGDRIAQCFDPQGALFALHEVAAG